MKIAEQVTFGGSGLDRAGLLRDKLDEIAKLAADPTARALLLWRGRVLLAGEERDAAGYIPMNHKVLHEAKDLIFLGLDDIGPRFAYDISSWEPAEIPDTFGDFFWTRPNRFILIWALKWFTQNYARP